MFQKRINQWVIAILLMNDGIQMKGCHSWLVNNSHSSCWNYVEKNRALKYLIEKYELNF